MKDIQEKILDYYAKKGRKLPWRETTDPYKILISEIMLQQTQVDRVIPKYLAFLEKFPDFEALANADTAELLKAWQGLGYNNRALRLRELAKKIVNEHNGVFPSKAEELELLPGIGKYTSRSVLIFAFNHDIVTIDTNIRRILIAELKLPESVTEKELYFHAEKLLPQGKSRDWHNALMDYGATLLTARKTGIKPVSKQSKFSGSDRFYRGQILKQLLSNSTMTINDICAEYRLDPDRVEKIVASMKKDNLIVEQNQKLKLK